MYSRYTHLDYLYSEKCLWILRSHFPYTTGFQVLNIDYKQIRRADYDKGADVAVVIKSLGHVLSLAKFNPNPAFEVFYLTYYLYAA